MNKRIFSLLLALLMVVGLLPLSAISSSAAVASIYVGGLEMNNGTYLASGGTKTQTTKPSGGYAYYYDGVLSLHDYAYSGTGVYGKGGVSACSGIFSAGSLKIELYGTSTIDMQNTLSSYAVHTISSLTICAATGQENATLKLRNCTDGIDAGGVSVSGGKTDISSKEYGIRCKGSFAMTGGNLLVTADSNDGICADNIVLITGGTISIDSGATGINTAVSYGQTNGTVLIYGDNCGISAGSTTATTSVMVIGGEANVYGGNNAVYSCSGIKFTNCRTELISSMGAALRSYNSTITFEKLTVIAAIKMNGAMENYSAAKNSSYRHVKAYDMTACEVIVGGVSMPEYMYLSAGSQLLSYDKPDGGYAYYADGVLTLNNYSYTGGGYTFGDGSVSYRYGIYSTVELTVELYGNNSIDTVSAADGVGIYSSGALIIRKGTDADTGTLTVQNCEIGISHVGLVITSGDITIKNASISGIQGNDGLFLMSGGSVNVDTPAEYGILSYGTGVYFAYGNITLNSKVGISCTKFGMTGGTLTITAKSDGIRCTDTFTITDGALTVTGGSFGVYAEGDVNINGGTVFIHDVRLGIWSNHLNFNDGDTTIISIYDDDDDYSQAMVTKSSITFAENLVVRCSFNTDGSNAERYQTSNYREYDYVYVGRSPSRVEFSLSGYRAGNRLADLVLTGPDDFVTYSGYVIVDRLVAGTSYDFEVIMTIKDGMTFTGDPEKDITLDGLLPETVEKKSSGNGYVLTYALPECPGQSVSQVGVFGLDAPVPGGHPDFTADVSNPYAYKFANYGENGCGFYWFDSEGAPLTATDTFVAGEIYSLEIKIEPDMDNGVYSFTTPVTGTLNGETADVMANSKAAYITATYVCDPMVCVGGVGMSDGDYLAVGATKTQSTKPSGGYAYYKGETLTLHNYEYTGDGTVDDYYGGSVIIYTKKALTIHLEGVNCITSNSSLVYGIVARDDLSITSESDASLTIDTISRGIGVDSGNIYIADSNIVINSRDYGIWAYNYDTTCITVSKSTLNITSNDLGIYAEGGGFTATDSVLNISSDQGGFFAEYGDVNISGSSVNIDSADIGIGAYYYQYNGNLYTVNLTDSTVTVNSESVGIFTDNINITRCELEIASYGDDSCALYADRGTISITPSEGQTIKAAAEKGGALTNYVQSNNDSYKYVVISKTGSSGSNVTVNCIGDIDYTVSGRTVKVDHEVACKLGYLSGGSYVAITAVANGDGTYSFTAPAGVTEVILAVKGDVTGDGKINVGDTGKVYAHVKKISVLTDPIALFIADVTGDGKINVGDTGKIYAHVKKISLLTW